MTDISSIPGYDATKYASLVEAARTEYVSQDTVDKLILSAVIKGKTFDEAVNAVKKQLPSLPPPLGNDGVWQNGLAGLPSMGAHALALISTMSAEERREAQEQRNLQAEATISELKEQAETIQNKAIAQLCMGIATGLVSIAQGIGAGVMTSKGIAQNQKITAGITEETPQAQITALTTQRQTADLLLNTRVATLNSTMSGVNSALNGVNGFVTGIYDTDLKESDARIERMRAQVEALNSLQDALKETAQKSISTMEAIQQNTNQARTRILT